MCLERGPTLLRVNAMPGQQLQPYLRPGERVLWTGAPDASRWFSSTDLLLVPFSLMWAGFAFFWEATVWTSNAPIFFRLWGIPFCLVGLYLVVGRFFVQRWRAGQTTYAVTDDRAIAIIGNRFNDLPLKGQPINVKRSGRHAMVGFGIGGFYNGMMRYPQTSWTRSGAPGQVAFFNVLDPEPMLAAVETARAAS